MSELLKQPPYAMRDDELFLREMNALVEHHRRGCTDYGRIIDHDTSYTTIEDIPFLHVGLFKRLRLETKFGGMKKLRLLKSSSTTGDGPSMVQLDESSSKLQEESTTAILQSFLGNKKRPLLIVDGAKSLRSRGELSARLAAALTLKPLASDLFFLLKDPEDPASLDWKVVEKVAADHDEFLVYGFTWILWLAWAAAKIPSDIKAALRGKRIHFVHSGGWKKLESIRVDRRKFDGALMHNLHVESKVVDFYGLVEQVGVIYPMCEHGYRHAPAWAEVLARDPYSLKSLTGQTGQLQLLNLLSMGAPCHSVLTEDLGVIEPGSCPCGRLGTRFHLQGRVPKSEIRGCANV